MIGTRYGQLMVIAPATKEYPRQNPRWWCKCDCGAITAKYASNLRNGSTQSCGCFRQDKWEDQHKELVFNADGYAFAHAPHHPRSRHGRVREHILVMEKALGRYLLPEEEVHHLNADKADNRLENLELWTRSHPAGSRVTDKVAWATEILRTYAPERLTTM